MRKHVQLVGRAGGDVRAVMRAALTLLRNKQPQGRFYTLGIERAHRRSGAGSLLLGALEEWLVKEDAGYVTLETRAGRTGAWAFFRAHGYAKTEDLPGYCGEVDGVRIRKDLGPA
ncbi:MAG: GNAT family N-acetyltransferase [Planctomycetota bacterium]|nr:MAG: GNAT family N-acetyltransferase [Planctomycetota bacterium]